MTRVLDMGCGIRPVAGHGGAASAPGARYHGVNCNAYLCERFGWERGSVRVDFTRPASPFGTEVICQGVLPYLGARDLRRALDNLGRLCRGACTWRRWRARPESDIIDGDLTDPRLYRHRATLYRQGLEPHFTITTAGVRRTEQVLLFGGRQG